MTERIIMHRMLHFQISIFSLSMINGKMIINRKDFLMIVQEKPRPNYNINYYLKY